MVFMVLLNDKNKHFFDKKNNLNIQNSKNDEITNNNYDSLLNKEEIYKDIDKLKNVLLKNIYTLAYSKLNSKIDKKMINYFTNEIIINYKINKNENKLRLFGQEFCEKNKNKCKIIINNEKKRIK